MSVAYRKFGLNSRHYATTLREDGLTHLCTVRDVPLLKFRSEKAYEGAEFRDIEDTN